MTFAEFVFAYLDEDGATYGRRVWKLIAFCARYGHTSAVQLLRTPRSQVVALSESLSELLEEEADSLKGD